MHIFATTSTIRCVIARFMLGGYTKPTCSFTKVINLHTAAAAAAAAADCTVLKDMHRDMVLTASNRDMQVMQSNQEAEEVQEGSMDRVQAAEAEVAELERRVARERQAFAQVSANGVASSTHFDLQVRLARHLAPKWPWGLKM